MVVVGAGVAGLHAAAKLHEAGARSCWLAPGACFWVLPNAAAEHLSARYGATVQSVLPDPLAGVPVLLLEASDGVGGRVRA